MEKGQAGYLNQYKQKHLIRTLIYVGIILAFIIGGVLIFGSKGNIMTILGVLFSLPMAKALTGYLVAFRYRSCSSEICQQINTSGFDKSSVLYDVLLSSPETVMYLPAVVISRGQVTALFVKKSGKVSVKQAENYLQRLTKNTLYTYKVQAVETTDAFYHQLNNLKGNDDAEANLEMRKTILLSSI